jgi:hypothetical protein
MNSFTSFDPLSVKYNAGTITNFTIKRELNNILSSYTGWYDPFCEAIQNSLDSVEERSKAEAGKN